MDRRPVDMVRVPREEVLIEREAVLGRDTRTVFPTESVALAKGEAENAKAALGALKFVSESELEEIRSQRGGRVEDGAVSVDKPLAQVLLEAKEAKEAAFQEQWRKMKQGKNRPLDEDELEFLETLEAHQRTHEQAQKEDELRELDAYQVAVRQAAELRRPPGNDAEASTSAPQEAQPARKPAAPARKSLIKPVIKPIIRDPPPKRQKVPMTDHKSDDEQNADALAGLMNAYDSDSSS
ncbi:hypothetical protein WJX72_010796 [[Myrmecia] bisecta]|uniref:FAM192A/Fyv6 N-terminal domain-containing protein n=1 Tax=[Myrmecia] bisecta TaxID=41462 RepID=A0AAW1PCY8_9CHLO